MTCHCCVWSSVCLDAAAQSGFWPAQSVSRGLMGMTSHHTHSVPKTISVHNSCKMFFSQFHDESCWKSWLDLNISALSLDREEKGACAVICTIRSITQIFEWFEWLDYSYKILERMTSTSHQQITNDHMRKQQCLFSSTHGDNEKSEWWCKLVSDTILNSTLNQTLWWLYHIIRHLTFINDHQ